MYLAQFSKSFSITGWKQAFFIQLRYHRACPVSSREPPISNPPWRVVFNNSLSRNPLLGGTLLQVIIFQNVVWVFSISSIAKKILVSLHGHSLFRGCRLIFKILPFLKLMEPNRMFWNNVYGCKYPWFLKRLQHAVYIQTFVIRIINQIWVMNWF